jgi:two-component system nitrogen regulation response regulator NtrX
LFQCAAAGYPDPLYDYLIAQISRFSGNISPTAEFVGMERSALHRKLKALGVG